MKEQVPIWQILTHYEMLKTEAKIAELEHELAVSRICESVCEAAAHDALKCGERDRFYYMLECALETDYDAWRIKFELIDLREELDNMGDTLPDDMLNNGYY